MQKIKNLLLLALRGIIYVILYQSRATLSVRNQIKKNSKPIVRVNADGVSYRMMVDLNDGGLSQDIFYAHVREFPNVTYFTKFLEKYGAKIDTIFEVGVNIGYYFLLEDVVFKKKIKKKVKIIAIDPVKESIDILRENFKLNKVKNATLVRAAVGDESKKVKMIVPKERNLSHVEGIDNVSTIKEYREEEVDMVTLSELFKKYQVKKKNVLFRWDIEGYEYNVVKGNLPIFKSIKNAFIIMEFHPQLLKKAKTIEFLNILKDIGFELDFAVSCYPLYFFTGVPKFMTGFLNRLWVWEKGGELLGFQEKFVSIDELIKEFSNEKSSLYSHPNLHLYLVKHE